MQVQELHQPNAASAAPVNGSPQKALTLVRELCASLDAAAVTYCHWKSNEALEKSGTGENDLDLLVARNDMGPTVELLARLGFKQGQLPPERRVPGILDYYGYDSESGMLVHLHLHYQLVLGHDLTKNYRVPIERAYLASAVRDGIFPVPSREFELIVFVIRMVLKHCTWDTMLAYQGRLSASERRELDFLVERVKPAEIQNVLKAHLPWLEHELFASCLESLQTRYAVLSRIKTGRRLLARLAPFARRSRTSDIFVKLWRGIRWSVTRHVLRKRARKSLTHSGAVIALIGGDGSGKSTAVAELYSWLSQGFATTEMHMGKPPKSFCTVVVKSAFRVVWRLFMGMRRLVRPASPSGSKPGATAGTVKGHPLIQAFWHLMTARDRARAFRRVNRIASNGGVVVCDRFPLAELRIMDVARLEQVLGPHRSGWLGRRLVELEKRYYRSIMSPNLLIVLRVDPETAVQRRWDEDPDFVRSRNREVWEADWKRTDAHVVDASQPQQAVLSEIKAVVWSEL